MKQVLSVLKAIKVFDPDNTLSLSNVAMMVIIGRLATTQQLDWTVLVGFFLTLLNHNSRKWFAKSKASKELTDTAKLEELAATVQKLNNAVQAKKL
jgi:hypothetical protein